MKPTKQILLRSSLHKDDASLLGERLASDVVLHEFIGSLHEQVNRSEIRLWIMVRMKKPSIFIRNELDRQLGKEWATETQKDNIANNEHILTSFSERLRIIREEMRVCLSLEDASSSQK